MVNNSNAQRNFQALLEFREENNPREQNRHSHRNPDRGSRNQVPGGWESVGDDGADRNNDGWDLGDFVGSEETSNTWLRTKRDLLLNL